VKLLDHISSSGGVISCIEMAFLYLYPQRFDYS
jgi:hypothetical protein